MAKASLGDPTTSRQAVASAYRAGDRQLGVGGKEPRHDSRRTPRRKENRNDHGTMTMHLMKAEGTSDFDELVVGMTVLELQSIERAMQSYIAAVKKAGRQTWREDDEVLDGLLQDLQRNGVRVGATLAVARALLLLRQN